MQTRHVIIASAFLLGLAAQAPLVAQDSPPARIDLAVSLAGAAYTTDWYSAETLTGGEEDFGIAFAPILGTAVSVWWSPRFATRKRRLDHLCHHRAQVHLRRALKHDAGSAGLHFGCPV